MMEVAITAALIALLSAIAMPSLLGMRDRYRLRSSATDVMSAIKRAQTEAVKRDARVALAFNAAAGICTIFVDNGEGGGVAMDSIQNGAEQTVTTTTIQSGNSLASVTFPPTNTLEFNGRGMPTNTCPTLIGPPPTPACFVIVTRPANLALQYRVTLNNTGHSNLQVSQNSGVTFD